MFIIQRVASGATFGGEVSWGRIALGRNYSGAKHPRGETSQGRNAQGRNVLEAKRPGAKCWGRSVGGEVLGAKCPDPVAIMATLSAM